MVKIVEDRGTIILKISTITDVPAAVEREVEIPRRNIMTEETPVKRAVDMEGLTANPDIETPGKEENLVPKSMTTEGTQTPRHIRDLQRLMKR